MLKEADIIESDDIYDLEKEIFGQSYEQWKREDILEAIKSDKYKVYIIKNNSNIIGYIIFTYSSFESYIAKFGISKEYRQQGYGKDLVEYAVSVIDSNEIFLEVRSNNIAAINLYKKVGFDVVGMRKGMYKDPIDDAIIMQRKAKRC